MIRVVAVLAMSIGFLSAQETPDWSARALAHGLYTTGSVSFAFSMNSLRPQLDCNFACMPIMLPKLKVATRLKGLVRRR